MSPELARPLRSLREVEHLYAHVWHARAAQRLLLARLNPGEAQVHVAAANLCIENATQGVAP